MGQTVTQYTFTVAQLADLIQQAILLYDEFQELHGHGKYSARNAVVVETLEGLDAERILYRQGEVTTPGQVLSVCLNWKLENTQ